MKSFLGLPETEVHIRALSFLPTLWLFGNHCKYVGQNSAVVKSVKDLRSFFVPDEAKLNEVETRIGRALYTLMGAGFPLRVQDRAKSITEEEYTKFLQMPTKSCRRKQEQR